jgi:hypothetical protein
MRGSSRYGYRIDESRRRINKRPEKTSGPAPYDLSYGGSCLSSTWSRIRQAAKEMANWQGDSDMSLRDQV